GIGTAAPQEGTNNSIVIELKNNKKLKYNFLINYKKEFELIKRILLYYKKNGVNVSYILKGKVII
ncbi:MAG: hypothetical protein GXO50_06975, partial [Chlorobi bacterium]|nr:hypothetical protein [Chlorobiota bacterium]